MTMIGVGAMIGTSIFVLIGVATAEIGATVIVAFALNGILTLFTAATYAELGSFFPEAGGGYQWAKKALPHPAGFLSGWLSWFGHTVACSYYALGFGYAIVSLTGHYGLNVLGLSDWAIVKLSAIAVIVFFLSINYVGVGAAGKTGDTVTMVQVMIVLFFAAFSLIYAMDTKGIRVLENFASVVPRESEIPQVLAVMGFTFIAFEGYEIIVQCGEEVRDPKKNIPRAIFVSVVVATALYVLVAVACLANFDARLIGEKGETAVIYAATQTIPYIGGPLLGLAAILSAMAALNATVFSSSRVSFAMGRDGSLPRVFGAVHKERRVPHNAILLTGGIMLFMALFFPLEVVVASTSIVFLLLFTIANIASIRLRRRLTKLDEGFRTPFFPLVPLVGASSTLGIAIYLWLLLPESWYVALIWIALGLALSGFAKPREIVESIVGQRRVAPRPLSKEEKERFRVFLALENLGDLRLVEAAGLFARYFDGDLTINKIVEVPRAMPLEAISKDYIEELSDGLRKVVKVTPSTVNVRPVVSVSYDVAGAILDQTRHEAANLLVLGWKGTRRRGRTILGRNLDRVVREAPCDVVILKTKRLSKNLERILLVSGSYFETRKALLLALPIAKEYGAKVVILSVITDDRQVELMHGNAERLRSMAHKAGVDTELKFIRSKSLVNTVVEHSEDCDLLVMGTGPQSALERTMFGAVYDRIIRTVDVPVLVLKTARAGKATGPPEPLFISRWHHARA